MKKQELEAKIKMLEDRIEKLEVEITNIKLCQLYPQPPYIICPPVSIPTIWINEPQKPYYETTCKTYFSEG